MRRALLQAAIAQKVGRSNWPTKGRCSWTKWETFRWDWQPKLLRVLQEQEFERLAALGLTKWTFGSWRRQPRLRTW